MTCITRRLAKWTAVVIAIGGFLAAYAILRTDVLVVFRRDKTVQAQAVAPIIPPYKTGLVTGKGGGDPYCRPRLAAYQAQYPEFKISVYEPPGEHITYYYFFTKQDRYRFSCIFSAAPKRASG